MVHGAADVILFDARATDPLMRVSAAAGIPQPVVLEPGKDKGTPGTTTRAACHIRTKGTS